ncbi:dephospho-CoA kinase [Candidatus Woesearchaeota archaeon]|nr:dephospho-CoA kinase [Candidatus Woesearchaeota archaeon]
MIIGITGSFGTGKTTVSDLFKKYGYSVINVDELYRDIYEKNWLLRERIGKAFGTADREELKKIVFSDKNKLKKLNTITHPVIINKIKSMIKKINKKNIIIDAPLLIEANAVGLVDKLIVVICHKEEQIKRLLKKGKYTKKEIDNIIKSQMPLKEKLKYADYIIDNSYSIDNTKKQLKELVKLLK